MLTERPRAGAGDDAAAGRTAARRRRRLPRRLVIAMVVFFVVGWGGIVALAIVQAAHSVQRAVTGVKQGVEAVHEVRHQLGPAELTKGLPMARLEAAASAFESAHRLLDRPYVVPLRYLPVIGRQLRSVTKLAGAASEVTRVGIQAAKDARVAFLAPHHTGPEHLTLLRRLDAIANTADEQLRRID